MRERNSESPPALKGSGSGERYLFSWPAVLVAAISFLLFTASSPSAGDIKNPPGRESAGKVLSSGDSESAKRDYFTDLKLITQEGREVRFYSDVLKDRVVVINAFYTNCMTVCPLQNKVLSDLQKLLGEDLGRDIFIVSITVDPERDTPGAVKEYAKVFAALKGWTFLTGAKVNVDWVNYKLGFYTGDPESHPATFLLGNVKTGHWMKLRPDAKAEALARHLRRLLEENGTRK